MGLLRRVILAIAIAFAGNYVPSHADSQQAMLQIGFDLGERPATTLMLAFRPRPVDAEPARGLPVSLPLYARHQRDMRLPLRQAAEDSRTFCEKSQVGCIAFASLIGIGIFFLVTQYEHEPESGQTTVTFTSGRATR
jgi:hypothetical protein